MIETLIKAGWRNIASNPLDGAVMYSEGETGDRSIYVQLYPYDAQLKGISEASLNNPEFNIRTSKVTNLIGLRLPLNYTPGEDGERGGIQNPAKVIYTVPVANNASPVLPDTILDCDYYVDKNILIMVTKAPRILDGNRQVIYFGHPATQYIKYAKGREVIAGCVGFNAGSCFVSADYPQVSYGTSGLHQACYPVVMLTNGAPNNNGKVLLSEPYYQSEVGLMGKLEGIYTMAATMRLFDGDLIKINDEVYKMLNVIPTVSYSAYGTNYLAIRIL